MNAPMTPDVALARLRQYGERTSTWSTATYNDGAEKALHEIALTLAAEVNRLSNDLTGAFLDRHEEEQESARLRLALESARRGRRERRARVSRLENSAALAEEDYGRIVRGACLVESQLRARIAELDSLQLGAVDGRVSATCDNAEHPTWLRAADDTRECPWCRVAELEATDPWQRAVAGLNALVDADVIFHVEPDGHISAPFSNEHIEWDLRAHRWVFTHDDEDDAS
ncbi:hypothetical protein [Streptomyces sp. NPDC054771]